jgi:2-keto-4-pentenoate hydratase/2-oxohepta-3-ene-1,7-dioic acid hydratase in catechol pathway
MDNYRLATLDTGGEGRAAVIVGGAVHDAADLTGNPRHATVQGILDDWGRAHEALARAASGPRCAGVPLGAVQLLAPIPRPGAIYCAGANYRDHAEEMARLAGRPPADPRAGGREPWFFLKSPRAVAPPGAFVRVTLAGDLVDWEAELVAVIGRKVRNVPVEQALDAVAGYTCGNDLSARDHVFRADEPASSPFRADWMRHKSFDDACPLGPWIVPAAFVPDPMNLPIRLLVNGALKQDSNTCNMIFSVAEQISFLSQSLTLHPGDLIMTGTPAGVGASRDEFLKRGDDVTIEIDGVGTLRNTVA